MDLSAQPIRVQTAPGAQVTAVATQLGTFANGTSSVTVKAGDNGIAVIDVRAGHDPGDYPVMVGSSANPNAVTLTIEVPLPPRTSVPQPPQ